MEGGGDDKPESGLEGTSGVELPSNRHGNFRVASSDQKMTQILSEIKSSKKPVRWEQTPVKFPSLHVLWNHWVFLSYKDLLSFLQAVINYGASWYVSGTQLDGQELNVDRRRRQPVR